MSQVQYFYYNLFHYRRVLYTELATGTFSFQQFFPEHPTYKDLACSLYIMNILCNFSVNPNTSSSKKHLMYQQVTACKFFLPFILSFYRPLSILTTLLFLNEPIYILKSIFFLIILIRSCVSPKRLSSIVKTSI